ncbi:MULTISPECIES: hypothetical protein [unclassified Rhodococcus (in: high G+C Gram-positive bacteria)]|uniref:hypothetical protein n=1 Tax=unclassified Rhodococcus (in: high G+C Gram-positive bacteria) TaxID=192944 RepID=UPI0002EAC827|nr:hypothetical protein [Rhodococcus sp. DK17]
MMAIPDRIRSPAKKWTIDRLGTYVTVMKSCLLLSLPEVPHQMGSPTVQQLDVPASIRTLMSAAPSNDSSGRDGV